MVVLGATLLVVAILFGVPAEEAHDVPGQLDPEDSPHGAPRLVEGEQLLGAGATLEGGRRVVGEQAHRSTATFGVGGVVVLPKGVSPTNVRVEALAGDSLIPIATDSVDSDRRFTVAVPDSHVGEFVSFRAFTGDGRLVSPNEVARVGRKSIVMLRLRSSYRLRVRAEDSGGAVVPRARLLLRYVGQDGPISGWELALTNPAVTRAVGDENGIAELDLLAGKYLVYAGVEASSYGSAVAVTLSPTRREDEELVVQVGARSKSVDLRVVDETGRPVPGAWVGFSREDAYRALERPRRAFPNDGPTVSGTYERLASAYLRTDEAGQCQVDGVPIDRPMRVSVGSPWHEIVGADVTGSIPSATVTVPQLRRRVVSVAVEPRFVKSWWVDMSFPGLGGHLARLHPQPLGCGFSRTPPGTPGPTSNAYASDCRRPRCTREWPPSPGFSKPRSSGARARA